MNENLRVIESKGAAPVYEGPYQEVASRVRDILKCDYALVAIPEKDSIRIQAIAGAQPEKPINLAADLLSKLRDWGPIVVDDSRMIAVPVSKDNYMIGVLVGYSGKPGTFTATDLERLLNYSRDAALTLDAAGPGRCTDFSTDELLHFSRLITIGELSACFAHDVTNPLTLIRGHLRFVEESLPPEHPLRINFEVIDRASRRIEEMSKRMLDFSKKRPQRKERCDIAEVISEAVRFIQPYVRSQFVDVQVQLEPELPPLRIDRWQIVQAIVNILQNAADAMGELDRRNVSISARVDKKQLRIAISDTGPGISRADLDKIYDPFFTTKGEHGTGLGLYITKQVIDAHRGTIDVQTGDRGTTFLISLPL